MELSQVEIILLVARMKDSLFGKKLHLEGIDPKILLGRLSSVKKTPFVPDSFRQLPVPGLSQPLPGNVPEEYSPRAAPWEGGLTPWASARWVLS